MTDKKIVVPRLMLEKETRLVIEWNAHMFSGDVERYPFHSRAVYVPDAADLVDDPLAAYFERMALEGIGRAVLVQPEPYGDDHRLILDCLARAPERLRATSLFYPHDPDAPAKLANLVRQHPGVVAVRFHAHRGKEMYLRSFADAGVRALWRAAAELGLVVELHIGPNYAAQAAEAIQVFRHTPVLIDHLGEPQFGSPEEYNDVLALARFPNVYMKLSGLGYLSSAAPLYEDAKPLTRRVADAFGPDRLVWGGGTPRIVDAHLAHLSAGARENVKGGNLARLLGLS